MNLTRITSAAAAAVLGALLAAGPAQASPGLPSDVTGFVCDQQGLGPCASPKPATPLSQDENLIQVSEGSAWKLTEHWVGKVTSTWPFTSTTRDGKLKGDLVARIFVHADTSYCVKNYGTSAVVAQCGTSKQFLWVIPQGATYIYSVGATNAVNAWRVLTDDTTGFIDDEPRGSSTATPGGQQWGVS